MKKLVIIAFLATSLVQAAQQPAPEKIKTYSDLINQDPNMRDVAKLKFILSHDGLAPKPYGVFSKGNAEYIAKKIHERFTTLRHANNNNESLAAQSLEKSIDAPIVHECALITERLRAGKDAGTVTGVNTFTGWASSVDGAIFYKSACPYEFYSRENLTDEQLKQIIEGTKPESKYFFW